MVILAWLVILKGDAELACGSSVRAARPLVPRFEGSSSSSKWRTPPRRERASAPDADGVRARGSRRPPRRRSRRCSAPSPATRSAPSSSSSAAPTSRAPARLQGLPRPLEPGRGDAPRRPPPHARALGVRVGAHARLRSEPPEDAPPGRVRRLRGRPRGAGRQQAVRARSRRVQRRCGGGAPGRADLQQCCWLHSRGCPWDSCIGYRAAAGEHIEVLRYAHEHGCPWDTWTCNYAAHGGHLEVLRYAHEHGCEWESEACHTAAFYGHLEVLRYAHERGCPWDIEMLVRCCGRAPRDAAVRARARLSAGQRRLLLCCCGRAPRGAAVRARARLSDGFGRLP
jgi:hypothetical protein